MSAVPPGPSGHILFGCLGEMRRNPMEFFTSVAQRYGGVARIRYGRNNYSYLVSDPELIRELLIEKADKYIKNVRYGLLQRVLGDGLLLSEGASWKRQKRIVRPAFHPKAVVAQVSEAAQTVQRFLDTFEERVASGEQIDIEPEFSKLAQLLAGSWIMGRPFEERAERIAQIYETATAAWPEAPKSVLGGFLPLSPKKVLTLRRCISELDSLVYEIIADYRKAPDGPNGLIPMLVDGHKKACGEELSDAALRDQLVTLFVAAHETSGSSLCWTHYLLSKHPEVRERMQNEVYEKLHGLLPTAEDLSDLPYLEKVINESLRLYSPIHSLSRVAVTENTIGGYTIPGGATVIVSLYATHRLPHIWENPEGFDPERFSPEESAKRANSAFIPFAAGHRSCIGGFLASLQTKMIVAQIAQRFDINLAAGHPIELMPSTTARPRYGMQVKLQHTRLSREGSQREGSDMPASLKLVNR